VGHLEAPGKITELAVRLAGFQREKTSANPVSAELRREEKKMGG